MSRATRCAAITIACAAANVALGQDANDSAAMESNVERRKPGWDELPVVGRQHEPRYDSTKRLEWPIIGEFVGEQAVNFNTHSLGRRAVTSAVLIAASEDLDIASVVGSRALFGRKRRIA